MSQSPLSEIVLDWDSHQIISASASDQLIATELIPVWIVRPFVVECEGTLSGDVWIMRWCGVRSLGFVNHPDEQVSFSPGPAGDRRIQLADPKELFLLERVL